ncbi:hypothetical protein K3495_g15110, partial [Podosphaera aphanis]
MHTESSSFKRPVETLSKANWRQFFVDLRLWFESKGLFYVCQFEKNEYCSKDHVKIRATSEIEKLTAAVAALHVEAKDPKVKSQDPFSYNEVSIQWEKDSSAVVFWLRQCCQNDLDLIEDNESPKRIWDALYGKYSRVKVGDLRQLEREITSFNREEQAPGKSPEECFAHLKALHRRFLLLKPEKKGSFGNEDLFGYLLDGLTEVEWKLTKDNIDAQPNLDCDEKLDILQRLFENTPSLQKAGVLSEDGLIANGRWPKSRLQRRNETTDNEYESSSKTRSRATGYRCYQCKSTEHRVDTCPYKEPAKEW